MQKLFLDTNVLLENPEYFASTPFAISSVTLEELENLKSNKNKTDDVRESARNAIDFLNEHHGEYDVVFANAVIESECTDHGVPVDFKKNDMKICACAWYYKNCLGAGDVKFITHDISCRNIAETLFALDVEWSEYSKEIYRGVKQLTGDTEYINEYMANIKPDEWFANEYLIINNTDDGSVREMRYDGHDFVALRLPPSKYIKGRNPLQRCALDILNNPSITAAAILGGYGSGKTALGTKMSLYAVQEKGWQSRIICLRETVSEGKEIGYLPGEKDLKIQSFTMPFADQLDGGEFELESLKQRGVLEVDTPYFIKGRTYDNSILLCDEAEDLTEKQIRLIGTRVGQNSRVIYMGDYNQSVINPTEHNALIKMCDALKGNPRFACIYLEEDERGETSKMFATLFK